MVLQGFSPVPGNAIAGYLLVRWLLRFEEQVWAIKCPALRVDDVEFLVIVNYIQVRAYVHDVKQVFCKGSPPYEWATFYSLVT